MKKQPPKSYFTGLRGGFLCSLEFYRAAIVDYLIDEIDRSMHPMLSQKILECYFSGLESGRDTQLIFSTHECNLLNLDLIRADEVWFVEKGKDGASHLTSLAEFKPREDVRKGYLLGRYGAIPLLPKEAMKW